MQSAMNRRSSRPWFRHWQTSMVSWDRKVRFAQRTTVAYMRGRELAVLDAVVGWALFSA